jgi:hypothetical protein
MTTLYAKLKQLIEQGQIEEVRRFAFKQALSVAHLAKKGGVKKSESFYASEAAGYADEAMTHKLNSLYVAHLANTAAAKAVEAKALAAAAKTTAAAKKRQHAALDKLLEQKE